MELIQRTLIECRKRGWHAPPEGVTEVMTIRKKRRDFLSIIDLVVFPPGPCLALQVTSSNNHAARVKKALKNEHLKHWLLGGCSFEVWSWRLKKGKWIVRQEAIVWSGSQGLVRIQLTPELGWPTALPTK